MASASMKSCRLCNTKVSSKKMTRLFSEKSLEQGWPRRISVLLDVPVRNDKHLPSLVCTKCITRINTLEKASMDLASFKRSVSSLKRRKETTGDLGVSPNTLRERPRSKVARTLFPSARAVSDESPRQGASLTCCGSPLRVAELASHCPESPTLPVGTPSETPSGTPLITPSTTPPTTPSQPSDENVPPQSRKNVTVTVSTPSQPASYTKVLGPAEGKVARALLGGHAKSIAKAVLGDKDLREAVIKELMGEIKDECTKLCKKTITTRFRTIPVDDLANFKWKDMVEDLQLKAPLLFTILHGVATRNDYRNVVKVGVAHYPGICSAAAILLKERSREMCGLQSLVSLMMYTCHAEKQLYGRLNHMNMCVSYPATLRLMEDVSKLHTVPIQQWIQDGVVFKFWGDNVDKQQHVRDLRSNHKGEMLHMFSILVGRSRTPAPELPFTGQLSQLALTGTDFFLPKTSDVAAVKNNLVILVGRILTDYFSALAPFSKVVPKHISHRYSSQMCRKSDVVVLDLLMKNETKHRDMLDIMTTLQDYLGENYPDDRTVLSGGDQLTCERQVGAQRHMMCGNTVKERLELLKPVVEDWHCLVTFIGVWWKCQYGKSNGDHGTLAFFRSHLNRIAVSKDPKKDVNACIDFITSIVKGHFLACACDIFGVKSIDEAILLPPGIKQAPNAEKLAFIYKIARKVVERCSLIEGCLTNQAVSEKRDGVYNYARTLCHYGSLILEFRDAWHEGDGERVLRCWKLFLPHFKVAGCTKYALEALKLQIHTGITCSPNLAHQITWNRFVNVKGGAGNNIPCDLHNEHVNKLLKQIVGNMGSNLTEAGLQRSARSVTALQQICDRFDAQSGVPHRTTVHSTKCDRNDVKKVVATVLKNKLLVEIGHREHRSFRDVKLNPLHKWDVKKTETWIKTKMNEYLKYNGNFRSVVESSDIEGTVVTEQSV